MPGVPVLSSVRQSSWTVDQQFGVLFFFHKILLIVKQIWSWQRSLDPDLSIIFQGK